jgi:hypothetical protein
VLQVFIDDSRENPVYLLAGYLAPSEQWAAFSDEWRRVLEIHPRLAYFKMKEAFACRGQFEGWSAERRDERLIMLNAVIEGFASAAFFIAFDENKFRKTMEPVAVRFNDKKALNPYYFAVNELTDALGRNQHLLHVEGPMKFIFDQQMMEKRHVIEGHEWAWARAVPSLPNLKDIVGRVPSFEDDKEFLPLQAADMHAWWMRRRFVAQAKGQQPLIPPWIDAPQRRTFPVLGIQFNEQQLRENAAGVIKTLEDGLKSGRF